MVPVGDVAGEREDLDAGAHELVGSPNELVLVPGADRHLRAGTAELPRERKSQPAGAAGHERHLPAELESPPVADDRARRGRKADEGSRAEEQVARDGTALIEDAGHGL